MPRRGNSPAKRHPAYGGGTPPYSSTGTHRVGTFDVASDGRSAHEHHGVGELCSHGPGECNQPGGVHFNDNTPSGKHSHSVIDTATGKATTTRDEGHNKSFHKP